MTQQDRITFARLQLAEIDAARAALAQMREQVLDHYDDLIAGSCAECAIELFVGDNGHRCEDGDPLFCAEHAYTWADVKESYEVEGGIRSGDPERYAEFLDSLAAHVATGGSIDDAVLHVL